MLWFFTVDFKCLVLEILVLILSRNKAMLKKLKPGQADLRRYIKNPHRFKLNLIKNSWSLIFHRLTVTLIDLLL